MNQLLIHNNMVEIAVFLKSKTLQFHSPLEMSHERSFGSAEWVIVRRVETLNHFVKKNIKICTESALCYTVHTLPDSNLEIEQYIMLFLLWRLRFSSSWCFFTNSCLTEVGSLQCTIFGQHPKTITQHWSCCVFAMTSHIKMCFIPIFWIDNNKYWHVPY